MIKTRARALMSALKEFRLLLLNNEEIKATYTLPRTEDTKKCRFHLLSETVLLRQIWDCPVHDYDESKGSNVSLKRIQIIVIE
jgi:hypothetical protein